MKKELFPVILLSFVNTLNFSIMIPILPFIIRHFGGGDIMYGILLSVYPFFQFFATPILGSLSDHFGRRPILLISQAGTTLSWVIFLISAVVDDDKKLWGFSLSIILIIISRIADGLTGGNTSVANAYLSDVTTNKEKTQAFGVMGAVVGVGMVIGPAIGGLTMSTPLGYIAPIIITLSVSIITLLSMYKFLPESLPQEKRKKIVDFNFYEEIMVLSKLKKYAKNRQIKYLISLRAVFLFVFTSFSSIIVLYFIDEFKLSSHEIGLLFVLVGIFIFTNQTLLLSKVIKKIGDLKTFILGQIILAVSQFMYIFTTNMGLLIPVLYFNNAGMSLSMPTYKSLISNSVDSKNQGEIMGIDESLLAAMSAISPIIATILYSYIKSYVFGLQAIILILAVLFFIIRKGWLANK